MKSLALFCALYGQPGEGGGACLKKIKKHSQLLVDTASWFHQRCCNFPCLFPMSWAHRYGSEPNRSGLPQPFTLTDGTEKVGQLTLMASQTTMDGAGGRATTEPELANRQRNSSKEIIKAIVLVPQLLACCSQLLSRTPLCQHWRGSAANHKANRYVKLIGKYTAGTLHYGKNK